MNRQDTECSYRPSCNKPEFKKAREDYFVEKEYIIIEKQ